MPTLLEIKGNNNCNKLLGRVKINNRASEKAFIKGGYSEAKIDGYIEYSIII